MLTVLVHLHYIGQKKEKCTTCFTGVRNFLLNVSNAGGTPVVEWGTFLFWNRNVNNLVCIDPPVIFFTQFLNVWTARSAWPLEAGLNGALVTCFIRFCFMSCWNMVLVNVFPSSETIAAGSLYLANMSQFLYSRFSLNTVHDFHHQPFCVGVYYKQEHFPHKRTHKINMQVDPWPSRPFSQIYCSFW